MYKCFDIPPELDLGSLQGLNQLMLLAVKHISFSCDTLSPLGAKCTGHMVNFPLGRVDCQATLLDLLLGSLVFCLRPLCSLPKQSTLLYLMCKKSNCSTDIQTPQDGSAQPSKTQYWPVLLKMAQHQSALFVAAQLDE